MSQSKKSNTSRLFFEILTKEEEKEFPKLSHFANLGFLFGGTALALQLNHRHSYDFDVCLSKSLPKTLPAKARSVFGKIKIINYFEEQLTFITSNNLKITFVYYPFSALCPVISTPSINVANWKDIVSDKAYAIGRRALYRDYVDLFCVMKDKKISLDFIIKQADKKFGGLFSEKLFLEQLTYFDDLEIVPINFTKKEYGVLEIQSFFEKQVKEYLKKPM